MPSYNLYINKKQAEAISTALEFYARIGMGQFDELLHEFTWPGLPSGNRAVREIARRLCDCLKAGLLPDLAGSSYHGITSEEVSAKAKIAYDIHQVIRHHLAWESIPSGGSTVDFNTPLNVSGEQLPQMEKHGPDSES